MSSLRKKKKDEPIEEPTIIKAVRLDDNQQTSGVTEDVENQKRHEDIDGFRGAADWVEWVRVPPSHLQRDPG